jgi:hypothetical protein
MAPANEDSPRNALRGGWPLKRLFVLMLFACSTAFAAVHPTKAQAAYLDEHDRCVSALRAAKKDAKAAPEDQRRKLLDVAKQAYRRCQEHAHLVWKFYPLPPQATNTSQ